MTWMLLLAAALAADVWPQFRGPEGAGVAEDAHLPERWSQTENVAWKAEIPGVGWSSPVVWGNRVFVTSVIPLVEQEKPRVGIYLDGRRVNPRPRSNRGGVMQASVGDRIIVKGLHLGDPDRDGEILAVDGSDGAPPYQVRWEPDSHVSLFFPGSDAIVEHHGCIDRTAVR